MRVALERKEDVLLSPLGAVSFESLPLGTYTKGQIAFRIDVAQEPLDSLHVEIMNGAGFQLSRALPASLLAVGSHVWSWEGFDQAGVLDVRTLEATFKVEFRGTRKGKLSVETITMRGERAGVDWLDAVVDRNKKTVRIDLRVHLKEGRSYGVGEPPPEDARSSGFVQSLPKTDPRTKPHARARTFAELCRLAADGIKHHWSRPIRTGAGTFDVTTQPILTSKRAMDDVSLAYNTNRPWLRSSNPGRVRGFYSLFGNFVPERIAYNVGWIQYSRWIYETPATADLEFSLTAAHEIGHEILSAYGGDAYSYSHRGSSTIISQSKLPLGEGGVSYPSGGSVDLMKYYHGVRPPGFRAITKASEEDVQALLWLSRVRFRA